MKMTSSHLRYLTIAFCMLLAGCVISSPNEIIKNKDSFALFNGADHLYMVQQEGDKFLLKKGVGEKSNTYALQAWGEPDENAELRFYMWDNADVLPELDKFIVSIFLKDSSEANYIYTLLGRTYAGVWVEIHFDPENNKEIIVSDMKELEQELINMINSGEFERQELIGFKIATPANIQNFREAAEENKAESIKAEENNIDENKAAEEKTKVE